jgi:CBS domain-containing protein
MSGQLVRDVMTRNVVVVTAGCGYKQIVDTLIDFRISAAPVVDKHQRVIGVVSEADLLHKAEFDGAEIHPRLFEGGRRRAAKVKATGETARELMTSPAFTVDPGATVGEAARLMERHNLKRLPVVDGSGALVGIVSRRDLLRQYLRPDAAIRREVVEGVLRRTMWLDPLEIDAFVEDGRVTLTGTTDRRSTAEIAVALTRGVPGVVGVVSELTWHVDDTEHARQRYLSDTALP